MRRVQKQREGLRLVIGLRVKRKEGRKEGRKVKRARGRRGRVLILQSGALPDNRA